MYDCYYKWQLVHDDTILTRPHRMRQIPPTASHLIHCSGRTARNRRCHTLLHTRNSLSYPARPRLSHFCRRHLNDLLRNSHFISRKTQLPVAYSGAFILGIPYLSLTYVREADYVPAYLDKRTQALLRQEMFRTLSRVEKPGHIYALKLHLPRSSIPLSTLLSHNICFRSSRARQRRRYKGRSNQRCTETTT